MTLKKTSESMMKISVKIAVYVVVVIGIVFCARESYSFGKTLFSESGRDKEPGRDITVTVESGDSNYDIAKKLESEGVVDNALAFYIQIRLYSSDKDEIVPGDYSLNSSKSGEELVEILNTPPTEAAE